MIRRLKPDEWPLYRALWLQALATDPHAFCASLEDDLAQPDSYWRDRLSDTKRWLWFAFMGDEPVGLAAAYRDEVTALYVAPVARGRSTARELLATLLNEIDGPVELDVTANQSAAIQLYRSMGFEVVSEQEAEHPDGSVHRLFRMRRS